LLDEKKNDDLRVSRSQQLSELYLVIFYIACPRDTRFSRQAI